MNKFCGFFILIFIFAMQSCQEDQNPSGFVNIADEYDLYITQALTSKGGVGAIEVRSIEMHECSNAFLSHRVEVDEASAELYINDIVVEGDCQEQPEIVKTTANLDVYDSNKSLKINLKGVINNTGTFKSSASEFELDLVSKDGLKINKSKINRVKEQMIWGHFSSANQIVTADLLLSLAELDQGTEIEQGDYGLFYIDVNGNVVYDSKSQNSISFIISSAVGLEQFSEIIDSYVQVDPSLAFHATNYDGRTIDFD